MTKARFGGLFFSRQFTPIIAAAVIDIENYAAG